MLLFHFFALLILPSAEFRYHLLEVFLLLLHEFAQFFVFSQISMHLFLKVPFLLIHIMVVNPAESFEFFLPLLINLFFLHSKIFISLILLILFLFDFFLQNCNLFVVPIDLSFELLCMIPLFLFNLLFLSVYFLR